ncbi:succinyl-CoA synthetase, beta subunit [Candidatus Desulfofervidus auxilii]|uniref:Succinate--CoA ligase [ADP-forming] subunit beta n=1 Tax=Desulfofervidus auxilii TaxID=1621989 RepID=A0A7U4QKM2_DESA2|nr:ADP-forming succinate--CoA ligase subunit beta [Candidatus Desulfofervidus auxilii]AMM41085.1 succinyl-CoA synthetase, beta subunit [Candidatus Desulfofervidus auxilii]
MKIHEYQAKEIFKKFSIPIPEGRLANTVDEVKQAVNELGLPIVIKAQIQAGGRGKAGGVRLAKTLEEAENIAQGLLGKTLVTHQTGPQGKIVRKVLIEKASDIKQEFYIGLTIDRTKNRPVMMVSPAGGMEIEELAREKPELIFKEAIDPFLGLLPYQARALSFKAGLPDLRQAVKLLLSLYKLFVNYDCSLAEINPLALTSEGQLLAIDAKLNFDDSGLYRHPDIKEMLDPYELDPLEYEAMKHHLNYVRLDGNVGIMVNGAGLAMATMDVIKLYGAKPANFLDVGGGANVEMITQGLKILLSDPNVNLIFINIFGGILRCDVLAQGVIQAAKEAEINIPILVRLEGTNVEIGRKMLAESGLNFVVAKDISDAGKKIGEILGRS